MNDGQQLQTMDLDRVMAGEVPELGDVAPRMARRVVELDDASVDGITDTRALRAEVSPVSEPGDVPPADRVRLVTDTPNGRLPLRVLGGAHKQIADRTGIPRKYYDRMLEHQPDLLTANVNRWLEAEPENRLLRMLKPLGEDERERTGRIGAMLQVRAFLSDAYRPLDHHDLVRTLLPVLAQNEAEVTDFSLTHDHFHLRFASEAQEILRQFYEEQPRLTGIEEVVRFGGAVRNSETGHGALVVQPAPEITRCTNVLAVTDRLRVVHRGGRTEAEESFLQADTKRLDDAATFLKVRDRVIELFSPETTRRVAERIADAAGEELATPDETPVMEFVGDVGKSFDLTDEQVWALQDEFANEIQETGRRTRWGLSQAFTAIARRLADSGDVDYDARLALEEAGWQVLDSPFERLVNGG